MTPSGIEPATYRFVAQYLNYCATAVPEFLRGQLKNTLSPLCVMSVENCNDFRQSTNKLADHLVPIPCREFVLLHKTLIFITSVMIQHFHLVDGVFYIYR